MDFNAPQDQPAGAGVLNSHAGTGNQALAAQGHQGAPALAQDGHNNISNASNQNVHGGIHVNEGQAEVGVQGDQALDARAGVSSKRKRGSSTNLDDDAQLARELQEGYDAAARRKSTRTNRVNYNTDDMDDDEDFEEEEEEERGRSGRPSRSQSTAAPPRPPAAQNTGLKLKINLPNPRAKSNAALNNQTQVYQQQNANNTRGPTPSYQQQGTTGFSTEGDEGDDEVQWLEWDDDEAAEAQEEAAKKMRRMPHCLLSVEELQHMDDEVERILGHRDVPGAEVNPKNRWASREFYIKWARYSYIHCSWDAYTTLKQLGGFKRVLNYCKKMDALEASKANLTAEEREEVDIRLEMEAELEREHSEVERIVSERVVSVINSPPSPGDNGMDSDAAGHQPPHEEALVQYLCKWNGLPYSEATWESEEDVKRTGAGHLIEAYRKREATSLEPRRGVDAARKAFAASGQKAFEKQPDYLQGGGTLRDYQLDGLNWMAYSWARGVNGILADEMGLGKTVQCASMIGYLSQAQFIGGPFIVIVPLSTVPNWAREFKKWIPQVNAVVYVGDAPSREVIRTFEFPLAGPSQGRQFKFDVLITTYELALKDASILRNVKWSYMMVDEAHRLKNNESALYRELSQWTFKSKLLITGTPLQNNMRELWCLLHFLHPEKFPSAEDFEADHDPKDPAGVQRLHAALRPHLLRRVIKDVEKSLPPKNERILRVPMTPLQKQYYRWILTRNFKELNKSSKGNQVTLLNIIMDLKKCCNHPFLFESAREQTMGNTGLSDVERLVVTSGKMVLLDKLLRRLKETGHRVLIFSQMVRVLDILSEYMSMKGYRHQRLDGSTPAHQRHQAMERFNAPDSQDFAFLLSTRAGGLGINLATADTVLLFDSDWNPQNDLQAMARAHRIGQKEVVNIYRLVASGSVEEDILERAKNKMVLDHVVIQRMDTSGRTVLDPSAGGGAAGARMFGKDELAAILKFGAGELFKDDGSIPEGSSAGAEVDAVAASGAGLMTDEDLDAILARAEVVEQKEEEAPGGAGDLLASFNVATFKTNDEDDAAFWNRLIPEHLRPKDQPEITDEPGIRTARLRAMEGPANPMPELTFKPKVKKPKAEPGPPIDGAMLRIDRWPQAVDEEGRLAASEDDPRPNGFPRTMTRKDAGSFVRSVKRHGLLSKLDLICSEAGLSTQSHKALFALWYGLIRGCEKAVDLHSKRDANRTLQTAHPGSGAAGTGGYADLATPAESSDNTFHEHQQKQPIASTASIGQDGISGVTGGATAPAGTSKIPADARLDFFGSDVRAADVLAFVRQMSLLENKIGSFASQSDATRRLRLTMAERPAPTAWMRACAWTPEDDSALLIGVFRHGLSAWDKIAEDADLRLDGKLAGIIGKVPAAPDLPKSSHLETRTNGLLRQIEKVATRPPKPPRGGPASRGGRGGGAAGGGGPGHGAHAGAKREHSAAAIAAFKEVAARCEAALGPETCIFIRKLRTLQRQGIDMDTSLVINKTRKYLNAIGKKIDSLYESVSGSGDKKAELWAYVSEVTENALSGDQLEHVYRKVIKNNIARAHKNSGGTDVVKMDEGDGQNVF